MQKAFSSKDTSAELTILLAPTVETMVGGKSFMEPRQLAHYAYPITLIVRVSTTPYILSILVIVDSELAVCYSFSSSFANLLQLLVGYCPVCQVLLVQTHISSALATKLLCGPAFPELLLVQNCVSG